LPILKHDLLHGILLTVLIDSKAGNLDINFAASQEKVSQPCALPSGGTKYTHIHGIGAGRSRRN
jgi:hypothetical protein